VFSFLFQHIVYLAAMEGEDEYGYPYDSPNKSCYETIDLSRFKDNKTHFPEIILGQMLLLEHYCSK
jgi:hypothetical protein